MSDATDTASGDTVPNETHLRTCPLCEACCGLEITTRGDAVVRIRGDMADPISKGFICPKGSTLKHLHEDPDRLTKPRLRNPDGAWRDATWHEAFDEIAARTAKIVAEHGRDGLGVVLGNPTTHNLGGMLYGRSVIQAAGTRRIFSASTVDQMPKHVSSGLLWGRPDRFPLPDIDRTDNMLIIGANPWVSNGSLFTAPDLPGRLGALCERGTLTVVDPVRTKTAENATEHISIRPGTDAQWLLAIIHTLFDQDLVSLGRLGDHISGVDEVRAAVVQFSPEAVAAHTGIEAATTRRVAREFALAESACAYTRMGAHTTEYGTIASWATDVINVLSGNLDRPGGIMFTSSPTLARSDSEPGGRGFEIGRWTGPASGFGEVKGELPAGTLAQEITHPNVGIKALVVLACNPARSFPNSDRIAEALDELDLLIVVDPYVNATSAHAHVILPPTSALERSHYDLVFETNAVRSYARYSPAVFDTDAMREEEILSRLALALAGVGADGDPATVHDQMLRELIDREITRPISPIFERSRDDILDELAKWTWSEQILDFKLRVGRFGDGFGANPDGITLAKLIDEHPHGRDFGPLIETMPAMIKTVSGTVELAPEIVLGDLARAAEALAGSSAGFGSAGDCGANGLTLIGRRNLRTINSWMHNVRALIKGRDQCTLQVNPVDADRLGLVAGCDAVVKSLVGEVTAPVEITDVIREGVVSLPHGWGYDDPAIEMHTARERPGVNSNVLTDDGPKDPLSGNARLNGIPVEVVPA